MSSHPRGRVLFADDERAIRVPLATILREAGFSVDAVATGHEAQQALDREQYDVVVADIVMPGNKGLELVERCGDPKRLVPIVLVTGQPTLSTAMRAVRGQVVDYLVKPISPETLIACLDQTIAKQRALMALLEGRRRLESLVEAVESAKAAIGLGGVTHGERQLAPPAAREQDPLAGLAREELERLSPRERDVVRLLALGRPVQEVAETLKLSANTVRNHIKSVFAKLRVNSQVALLAKVAGHASTGPGSRSGA